MNSMQNPPITVIIPTKNRPEDLELAVRSLLRQSVLPRELIIVDQSRDAESRQRVVREFEGSPPQLREQTKLIYLHDTSIPGSAVARNRAMDAAQGDLLVFLDDDVELEPDFIRELLNTYDRYPQVDGVSGIITNYRPPPWPFRIWSWAFIRGPFRDERQPIYWNADRLRDSDPIPVGKFSSGVMSFPAERLQGIRFDEELRGVPGGEDVEFCARLPRGTRLVITPRARLVHKQSPTSRPKAHFLRRQAHATYYLHLRHWRTSLFNRLCFLWFQVGLGLATIFACLRRGSLEPWRQVLEGVRGSKRVCRLLSEKDKANSVGGANPDRNL